MSDRLQLEAEIAERRRKLWKIEADERYAENSALVGKCYRYRNSYACPKPNEKWWLYARVLSVGKHGTLTLHTFQTDKNGKIEIEFGAQQFYRMTDGYQPITCAEFNKAWRSLQKKIAQGPKP